MNSAVLIQACYENDFPSLDSVSYTRINVIHNAIESQSTEMKEETTRLFHKIMKLQGDRRC
jgi:hypothetical protein